MGLAIRCYDQRTSTQACSGTSGSWGRPSPPTRRLGCRSATRSPRWAIVLPRSHPPQRPPPPYPSPVRAFRRLTGAPLLTVAVFCAGCDVFFCRRFMLPSSPLGCTVLDADRRAVGGAVLPRGNRKQTTGYFWGLGAFTVCWRHLSWAVRRVHALACAAR